MSDKSRRINHLPGKMKTSYRYRLICRVPAEETVWANIYGILSLPFYQVVHDESRAWWLEGVGMKGDRAGY